MRKHPLLIAVAATALFAGANIASAQQPGSAGEKSAPAQKSPDVGPKAGGAKEMERPATPKSGSAPKSTTTGQGEKAEPKAKDTPKSGQADKAEPKAKDTPKSGQADKAEPKAKDTPKSGQADRDRPKSPATGQTPDQKAPAQKSTEPSGARPDATASVTVEQRTRIRETVLKQSNVPRVGRVDFQIQVGTVVPRTVRAVALPAAVVEIYPAWRGYLYFVHEDEIVVVEPGTLRIVAVLPA